MHSLYTLRNSMLQIPCNHRSIFVSRINWGFQNCIRWTSITVWQQNVKLKQIWGYKIITKIQPIANWLKKIKTRILVFLIILNINSGHSVYYHSGFELCSERKKVQGIWPSPSLDTIFRESEFIKIKKNLGQLFE